MKMESRMPNTTKGNNLRIKKRHCDHLDWSGKLLIVLFTVTLLCLSVPVLDTRFRPADDHTGQVIWKLNLSNLSITGSGRPLRHPEIVMASVNLNFSPHFCCFMINPEYLILNPPRHKQGHAAP